MDISTALSLSSYLLCCRFSYFVFERLARRFETFEPDSLYPSSGLQRHFERYLHVSHPTSNSDIDDFLPMFSLFAFFAGLMESYLVCLVTKVLPLAEGTVSLND